jgi:flagellar basal body-associated protein FliL
VRQPRARIAQAAHATKEVLLVVFLVVGIVVFFVLLAIGFVWLSGRQIRQREETGQGFSSSTGDDDVSGSPFD